MSRTGTTAELPAPVSLTLDEASAIVSGGASATLMPWWWFGQPANLSVFTQVVSPAVNVAALANAVTARF